MKVRLGPLGAPLAILLAWVTVRVAILVPLPEETAPKRYARQVATGASRGGSTPPLLTTDDEPLSRPAPRQAGLTLATNQRPLTRKAAIRSSAYEQSASIFPVLAGPAPAQPAFQGRSGTVAGYAPRQRAHRAFTGSGWALINGTGGAVGVPSLGGSQTGMRLFLQGEDAPVALTARVSRALGRSHDTEVSAGYALRADGLGLLVERRQRFDVKSGAFVVTGYGGVYDLHLPLDLRFDGFAQGGVAGIRQRRWFADGQARVTARALLSPQLSIGAGGGAWASAQQGARRVEAGPLVEARVRTGRVGLRVAGEYRFRVTGDAQPRSGPALTIGMDF